MGPSSRSACTAAAYGDSLATVGGAVSSLASVVRRLKVLVASNCTHELAAVQPGATTNSRPGQCAPALDALPNPAVAIGAVHLAPPSCGPCCAAMSLCARHGPQPFSPLV